MNKIYESGIGEKELFIRRFYSFAGQIPLCRKDVGRANVHKNKTLLICGAVIFAALLAGCDSSARRDAADERNPQVRKGLEQVKLRRWNQAIEQFEAALGKNPELARPNLELAMIYQQQSKNYVRAIYHYERYIEKRPGSEKRELILDWIEQAKISFAAQIGQSGGNISEELIRLTRENNLLRHQLQKTGGTASVAPAAKPAAKPVVIQPPVKQPEPTPVSKKPVQRIQTPAPIPDTYKVLPGDTLSRIARTVYGDSSKYKEIYGANLDKMKSENDLKAGQIITIPTLGN